jgi:hypothetical protein
MTVITETMIQHRFELKKTKYISERFEKSPNISKSLVISEQLEISYADQDQSLLPLFISELSQAYKHVEKWFGNKMI